MTGPRPQDFPTLRSEEIVYARLADFEAAAHGTPKAQCLVSIIIELFDDYYARSRNIPWLAKQAFETRDWRTAIALSHERIAIFSVSVAKAVEILALSIREHDRTAGFWPTVETLFRDAVADRYESDLAVAYLTSIRRAVFRDIWAPAEDDRTFAAGDRLPVALVVRIPASGEATPDMVRQVFAVPAIDAAFKDLDGDAARVAERINAELDVGDTRTITEIEVLDAGFYRNRGAFIVGAVHVGGERAPMALALLHREDGVEVDAVILREPTLRHVFSSTLANMHVTLTAYHELVGYLHALMPTRPRGMHYSTVGYNHVGKIAVMRQLNETLSASGERLDHAPGPRGSVAMGFTSPGLDYVLKVIRDHPTDQYKWGAFAGIDDVLSKYRRVHGLNRSGSMLDNIIYTNVTLPTAMFDDGFAAELLAQATETVSRHRGDLFFRHLIVQRKLVPVPLYLENCTKAHAEMVVIRLGQCIRNNAATGVFNKDLDGRNYGVSSLRFVYLFDYDAVEALADVKVRTNAGRIDGEEDIPDWFFEDGVVFLPEELEAHLRLPDRDLRRLFREAHGELLTADYWTRMQHMLAEGRVPRVRTYPRACQLSMERLDGNLELTPDG